jgi:hypothetical protein
VNAARHFFHDDAVQFARHAVGFEAAADCVNSKSAAARWPAFVNWMNAVARLRRGFASLMILAALKRPAFWNWMSGGEFGRECLFVHQLSRSRGRDTCPCRRRQRPTTSLHRQLFYRTQNNIRGAPNSPADLAHFYKGTQLRLHLKLTRTKTFRRNFHNKAASDGVIFRSIFGYMTLDAHVRFWTGIKLSNEALGNSMCVSGQEFKAAQLCKVHFFTRCCALSALCLAC